MAVSSRRVFARPRSRVPVGFAAATLTALTVVLAGSVARPERVAAMTVAGAPQSVVRAERLGVPPGFTGAPGGTAGSTFFDRMPTGAPPRAVPYAIGPKVYFNGHVNDLSSRFAQAFGGAAPTTDGRQFHTVTGAAGYAWTHFIGAAADLVHYVGKVSPSGGYTPFHVTGGGLSTVAVTTGGVVAMPENGQAYRPSGAFFGALTGSTSISCGQCSATAAGGRFVVDQWTSPPPAPEHRATWLWYPPSSRQQIDDRFRGVGRLGTGWLGLRLSDTCWRLAPADAPGELGSTICSLTTPLVNADGRYAVVVQGGGLRVVNPVTGRTISTGTMPLIKGWAPPTRVAVPAAWESPDSYLVTARVDNALAVVRCSASTGRCQRTVRATARAGAGWIVMERTTSDAVTLK